MAFEAPRDNDGPPGTGRGFARRRDEGERIELPGWSMLIKVAGADTAGGATVIEGRMASRLEGAPAHIHRGHDETFVMLEGRLRFRIGDSFHTAASGETIFAGRGLAHGFANPFDQPARYLVVLTPSGYERYFALVAEHISRCGVGPDPDLTRDLMARHQTVLALPVTDLVDP